MFELWNYLNWFLYFDGKKLNKNKYQNMIEYNNVLSDMITSYLYSYKFEGLPESCDDRTIKLSLLTRSKVCFFEENNDVFSLPFSSDGSLNLYGYPAGGYVYSRNGINKHIKLLIPGTSEVSNEFLDKTIGNKMPGEPRGVFVRENEVNYPLINYLMSMAAKIADTQRSLDVLVRNSKSPILISAPDNQVNNLKQIMNEIDNNNSYIVGSGNLPINDIKSIDMGIKEQMISQLYTYKKSLENEVREKLGLSNLGVGEKRERMITAEAEVNNQATITSLSKRVEIINKDLENVNTLFGTSIKAVINNQIDNLENEDENLEEDEEVKEDDLFETSKSDNSD